MLAFLIDQLQRACMSALQDCAHEPIWVQKVMWERMRSVLQLVDIPDWETLWRLLGKPKSEKAMLGIAIDTG